MVCASQGMLSHLYVLGVIAVIKITGRHRSISNQIARITVDQSNLTFPVETHVPFNECINQSCKSGEKMFHSYMYILTTC